MDRNALNFNCTFPGVDDGTPARLTLTLTQQNPDPRHGLPAGYHNPNANLTLTLT